LLIQCPLLKKYIHVYPYTEIALTKSTIILVFVHCVMLIPQHDAVQGCAPFRLQLGISFTFHFNFEAKLEFKCRTEISVWLLFHLDIPVHFPA